MTDSVLQLTLREWRQIMTTRQTLLALAAVSLVLAIAGPFGTNELLGLTARAAYWTVIVVVCYSAGVGVNLVAQHLLPKGLVQIVVAGLACAASVLIIVLSLNFAALGYWPEASAWPVFAGSILGISLIVNTALALLASDAPEQDADAQGVHPGTAVPLLERLPLDKRAPLVALSVEDHYVRVRTTKGEELLLMRLSDAMREVGTERGAQVHRSHWAGFGQVTAVRREGDRAILTMTHGADIPVSRANMAKIREAGLLPR